MEKSVMGLVAAIGAVAPLAGAEAAVVSSHDAVQSLHAATIADLLEPIPNAVAVLAALDAAPAAEVAKNPTKGVQVVQWHHHHHHYHHHYYHHHHHHYYHHHHHHWHRPGCVPTPLGWVCP